MRFSASTIAAFLMTGLTTVFAETFVVTVGKNATLLYDPPSINAKVGDVVSFQFMSKNHTVTQSTFDTPCVAKAAGVDSGFQFIPPGTSVFPEWSITVSNASAPLWFHCAQVPHCSLGMVFAINPTAAKTFAQYHANALASATPANGTASSTYGGAYGGSTPASSSSSSSTSASTAANDAASSAYGGAYSGSAPASSSSSSSAASQGAPASASTGANDTASSAYGAAYGGSSPAGSSSAAAQGTAAPASVAAAAESLSSGALSQAVGAAAWPVLLGGLVMSVLVL